MEMLNGISKKITIGILALLLVSSAFALLSDMNNAPTTAAAVDTTNLLQYEWPQWYGDEGWTDYSAGPGPVAGDLLWRVNVTGAASGRYYPAAFNGKVFIYSTNRMIAINGVTGAVAWDKKGYSTGMPYKLDNNHMVAGQTCFNPNDGSVYWTAAWDISPTTGFNTTFATSGGWGGGSGYSSTEKLFFTGNMAWNLSNPDVKPKIVWDLTAKIVGGVNFEAYGNGIVVIKSGDFARGVDAKTGNINWTYMATGGFASYRGMVYQGVFYKGMIDKNFIAINVTTGKEIWHYYDTTPFANFATGAAGAYGMVYMISGSGKLWAFNALTGAIVWVYSSPGWENYQGHPIVADGKVYATCPQGGQDPYTGFTPDSYYVCCDAYTGKLLWKIKGLIVDGAGGGAHLLAFGRLYVIAESGYLRCYSTVDSNSDWTMFRHDAQLTGVGLSGPSKLSLKWKYTTEGQVYSTVVAVNDRMYFGSYDQKLYCVNASTGKQIWNYTTGAPIGWSAAVVNGRVYTGVSDGFCYCLDAVSGALIWKKQCGPIIPQNMTISYLQSSPTITADGSKLFVGALDAYMYCLDLNNNGNILWSFKTVNGTTSANTGIKATPVIDGNTVWTVGTPIVPALGMFGSNGNISLWQLDFSGNVVKEIKYPYGAATAPTTATVFASPIIVGDYIIVPDQTVYWYCLNKTTGNVIWKYMQTYQTQFVNTAAAYDGQVVLTDGFFCQSMNLTNGNIIWRAFLKREIFNSATIAGYGSINSIDRQNFKVYSSNNDNMFYILNMTDGAKYDWSYDPHSFIMSSFSLYKGMAICGSRDFNVYCYEEASTTTVVYPTLTVASATSQITKGSSVTVTGAVFPKMTSLPLKVSFIRPDNSVVDVQAWTDASGNYQATYTPDNTGSWRMMSYYEGNADQQYQSTYSNQIGLTVAAAPTATPTAVPTAVPTAAPTAVPTAVPTAAPTAVPTAVPTAAPTEAPTAAPTAAPTEAPTASPESTQSSNDVYIYVAVVIVVIIVIAAIAAVFLRKKK